MLAGGLERSGQRNAGDPTFGPHPPLTNPLAAGGANGLFTHTLHHRHQLQFIGVSCRLFVYLGRICHHSGDESIHFFTRFHSNCCYHTDFVRSSQKIGPAQPAHVKIALVITAVDFDQFSLYSTGTSLLSDDQMWQTHPVATLLHTLKVQTPTAFNLGRRLPFTIFWIETDA